MFNYKRPIFNKLREFILAPRRTIQVITGPRQVGKTTLISQLREDIDVRSIFVSADEIIAPTPEWLDSIWQNARDEMKDKGESELILIIDEIQKIEKWSDVVKKNWDADTLTKINLKVIILGSSRLLLMRGLSESLLGRFFLHYVGHWSFREMSDAFGFSAEEYAWFGGYPGAATYIKDEAVFKDFVRNSIIDPSISKDILMLTLVTKPALLRRLFEMAASYSSQMLSYTKILGQIQDKGNASTLVRYMDLLDESCLVTALEQYSTRLISVKSSTPKFQIQNPALFSALQTETLENALADPAWWGRIIENAIGAHLLDLSRKNSLLKVYYYRHYDLEVDFVLKYGKKILAIEVKSQPNKPSAENLAAFSKKFPVAGVLLIDNKTLTWQNFLNMGVEQIFNL
jgi:predicted AAA+ superfamily ATPase